MAFTPYPLFFLSKYFRMIEFRNKLKNRIKDCSNKILCQNLLMNKSPFKTLCR